MCSCWFSCFCCCPRDVVDSPLSYLASTVDASPPYSPLEDRVGLVAQREIGVSPESRSGQRWTFGVGTEKDSLPPKTGLTRTSAPWSNKIPVCYVSRAESPDPYISSSDMEENSSPAPKPGLTKTAASGSNKIPVRYRSRAESPDRDIGSSDMEENSPPEPKTGFTRTSAPWLSNKMPVRYRSRAELSDSVIDSSDSDNENGLYGLPKARSEDTSSDDESSLNWPFQTRGSSSRAQKAEKEPLHSSITSPSGGVETTLGMSRIFFDDEKHRLEPPSKSGEGLGSSNREQQTEREPLRPNIPPAWRGVRVSSKNVLQVSSNDGGEKLSGPSRSGERGGSVQKTKRNIPPPSPAMTPYTSRGVRANRTARKYSSSSSDSDDEAGSVVKTQTVWHIHPKQGPVADRPYEISTQGIRFHHQPAHTNTDEF